MGSGFSGLASLGPFLGAPAGTPGVKYSGGTGSGAWHPLTPSWVPVRGASAPRIMEAVEVVQLVPAGGPDRGMPVPQIMLVRGGGLLRRASTGAVPGQGC